VSRAVLLAFALCLAAASASAQNTFIQGQTPEITLPPDFAAAPTFVPVKAMPATEVRLGKLQVVFEKTTLAQVRDKVGGGFIEEAHGGTWDGELMLCYTQLDTDGGSRIWFTSDSIYGGAVGENSRVLGIIVTQLTGMIRIPRDCPILSHKLAPIVLNGGIAVGMKNADVLKRTAAKAQLGDGQFRFDYDEPLKANDSAVKLTKATKDFRVGSSLTVDFVNGVLRTFSAQRITAN
jgi:hypothetical protein